MPFIACLNNVTNTHSHTSRHALHENNAQNKPQKTTTTPAGTITPQARHHTTHDPARKSQATQTYRLIQTHTHTLTGARAGLLNCSNNTTANGAGAVDARVHYADLKQQPHQLRHTPTPTNRASPRTPAKGGPKAPTTRLILQDPTVCLTPSPTNARQ